ncbi:MAG: hypothetical protein IPH26_13560 [Sterolibacteriaceae bacterium]|uniref:Uncharacterized protein n=1 Tax=Candidatus Methylophosphatis roskildensis TaxID=2899263 RepID=A0A9D7DZW5_9PROT|nr:hypothetical protein [Candidatus Methylophosphatis roskildensis]
MPTFRDVSDIYENVRISRIVRHKIASHAIADMMRSSSKLFLMLDRGDSRQEEISRRLWVLRSSVLFTLLPFDDPAIALQQQMQDLASESSGLPDGASVIESLGNAIEAIAAGSSNPKHEWMQSQLDSSDGGEQTSVGVLVRLSGGRVPGWPPDAMARLQDVDDRITLIRSRTDLRSGLFERIVLPCACRNTSPSLLEEVVHSGRARTIDVLLYPEENFGVPKRMSLPDCGAFMGRLQKTIIEQETAEIPEATPSVDNWMNEAFWQRIHGGKRSSADNLVPANYVLFSDGTGTFFPANGHVPVLPSTGSLRDESDLRVARVADLSEGDLVVMRVGDSNFLLDETSDRIMKNDVGDNLVQEATDWKAALDALLITFSCDEIAQNLTDRGVRVSPSSIHQWAGPDVLGPATEKTFSNLICLLGERRKIALEGDALHHYAATKWKSLQELRGVRHRAGNLIRQELIQKLVEKFHHGVANLGDKTSVQIDGEMGTELLVLKVSSADQQQSFVQSSILGRLDDHRGNPWLG